MRCCPSAVVQVAEPDIRNPRNPSPLGRARRPEQKSVRNCEILFYGEVQLPGAASGVGHRVLSATLRPPGPLCPRSRPSG
eukprot:4726266-Alexandrium_andersonii.AAC.1